MTYLEKLKKKIEREGSIKSAAEKIGVAPAYLGDVLNDKDRISIPMAYKLDTILLIDMFPFLKAQLEKDWADYLKRKAGEEA